MDAIGDGDSLASAASHTANVSASAIGDPSRGRRLHAQGRSPLGDGKAAHHAAVQA